MHPTRRFWEALAVAALLAGAALLFARPLLLFAPAGLLAFLLASQFGFVYAVGRLEDSLSVTQLLDRETTVTDEPVTTTLLAAGDDGGLEVTVTAHTSAGLAADGETTTPLGRTTTFAISSDVAGTHRLETPEFEVRDPAGLFVERFARGPERELTVEARRPRNVHVGEGGNALPFAFGEHTLETTGRGITPAELRQYAAGDPLSRIDWNATARHATPYVRTFEALSDRPTVLVVDARESLQVGPPGETALEYLRTVALSHVAIAERLGDPLGCLAVDDRGVRRLVEASTAGRSYERARRRLRGLTATTGSRQPRRVPPIQHRAGTYDDATRYGRVLETYARRRPRTDVESDPLQAAIGTALSGRPRTTRVVVLSADADRGGVQSAVSAVRGTDHRLDVFLAPTVLYERDALADLSRATARYRDFERFRRDIARLENVSAYEVAPRGRIEAVLERKRATVGD